MGNNEAKRKSMIQIRNGYSDNHGINCCNTEIQLEEFDDRTRIILSNRVFSALKLLLDNLYERNGIGYINAFCRSIISDVFIESNVTENNYEHYFTGFFSKKIQPVILSAPYNEVLDIIEYINNWFYRNRSDFGKLSFIISDIVNTVFEVEYVGYRFVDDKIIAITDGVEIKEIDQACNNKFEGCKSHIQKSVGFLADRENKDYKNSIKESISAVESMCKIIIGKDNATLGEALNVLEKKRNLKGQLKSAFEKLYQYTNDKGGIRHADGLFESNVTFEEAKFMLVSCSAFVNYLIAEYGKCEK